MNRRVLSDYTYGKTGSKGLTSSTSLNRFPCGEWVSESCRPGSAKDWVEKRRLQREIEAVRLQEWKATCDDFKKKQFQADFFNSRPSAPRCRSASLSDTSRDENKNEVQQTVPERLLEDIEIEKEDVKKSIISENQSSFKTADETDQLFKKHFPTVIGQDELLKPEIAALKSRLEELKKKNEEERKKLNEELKNAIWKQNSAAAKELESKRLAQFVRSCWPEQRRWLEQERVRRRLEEEHIQKEANLLAEQQKLKEQQEAEEKQKKKESFRRDLEKQLELMKLRQSAMENLRVMEEQVTVEMNRLQSIDDQFKLARQRREAARLAETWSRQYHLRLRQRSAAVLRDLCEEERLLQQLLNSSCKWSGIETEAVQSQTVAQQEQHRAAVALDVLRKHSQLERLREQEYELLFSEEARSLWSVREQQWLREQQMRDKLMREVLDDRRQQLAEKEAARVTEQQRLEAEQRLASQDVSDIERMIEQLESSGVTQDSAPRSVICTSSEEGEAHSDEAALRASRELELQHREEIGRLEAEMARLWGPLYMPPFYGRKKVQW